MRTFSADALTVTARPTPFFCELPIVVGRDVWAVGYESLEAAYARKLSFVSAAGQGRAAGHVMGTHVYSALGAGDGILYIVDQSPEDARPYVPVDVDVVTIPATNPLRIHQGCDARALGGRPDGPAVACIRAGVATVQWATGGGVVLWTRELDPESRYVDPSFSPSGHRLAVPRDDRIEIYDLDAVAEAAPVVLRNAGPSAEPAWSPDGSMIATSTATRGLGVWDTRTGELLVEREPDEDFYLFFRWIDGGRKLWVVNATYTMSLWGLPPATDE